MAELRRVVAGVGVSITGTDALLEPLGILFGRFPAFHHKQNPELSVAWQDDVVDMIVGDDDRDRYRAETPALQFALTQVLLQRGLRRLRPDLLHVHGNALRDRATGRLLLLVGESGAGKTTLSTLLLGDSDRFEAVSEDLLLLDAGERTLSPYPRALLVKEPGDHGWTLSGKKPVEHPATDMEPVAVARATVVLLNPRAAKTPSPRRANPSEAEVMWFTPPGDPEADLRQLCGDIPAVVQSSNGQVRVAVPGGLSEQDRGRILESAAGLRMVLMRSNRGMAGSERPRERPASPRVRELAVGDAVLALLQHTIRYTPHAGGTDGGRLFLKLAGLFADAEWFDLVPGGTPEKTAALLRKTIE